MALGRALAVSLQGVEGTVVEVEADISRGLPALTLVGLPDVSLGEARERMKSACSNARCPLPNRKTTINLLPASLPKSGTGFDLAMVMAVQSAAGIIDPHATRDTVFLAELGLDGRLRRIPGILPAVAAAVKRGHSNIVVDPASQAEASLVPGASVRAYGHVVEALNALGADLPLPAGVDPVSSRSTPHQDAAGPTETSAAERPDFREVVGQTRPVQAALAAAAGGHHLMLRGSPGTGKTMIARRIPTILPSLDPRTSMELTSVRSLAGSGTMAGLVTEPPFEAPHHNASMSAMVGGGTGAARPGAVSLAHGGVLFLDEAPEFARKVLDSLRQPLEEGFVRIHRSHAVSTFPARFHLVLAANPCPCGGFLDPSDTCACTPKQRNTYMGKISGPLLDRIDLKVTVNPVRLQDLLDPCPGKDSASLRETVSLARAQQRERLAPWGYALNTELPGYLLRSELSIPSRARASLDSLMRHGKISARGYDRTLRLSWTLADLRGTHAPESQDVEHALALRSPDVHV